MAEQSGAEATRELKKALHWINEEVDRLGRIWCAVSTERGGPGTGQKYDGMWKKIHYKYHNDLPPPPVPRDSAGRECLPRNCDSMNSKWKRTRTMMAKYMKCHMIALSNPQSGENSDGVELRALGVYKRTERSDFAHLTTYKVVKDQPKWRLDVEQLMRTVRDQTGAAVQSEEADQAERERIERGVPKTPTSVGTNKPEGVKRARRTMAEMAGKAKEVVKEEAALSQYLDALSQRKQLGITIVAEGRDRTRAMQEKVDDDLMRTDTTDMDEKTARWFELRKKHALKRLEEQDRIATEAPVPLEVPAPVPPEVPVFTTPTGTATDTESLGESDSEGEGGEGCSGSEAV